MVFKNNDESSPFNISTTEPVNSSQLNGVAHGEAVVIDRNQENPNKSELGSNIAVSPITSGEMQKAELKDVTLAPHHAENQIVPIPPLDRILRPRQHGKTPLENSFNPGYMRLSNYPVLDEKSIQDYREFAAIIEGRDPLIATKMIDLLDRVIKCSDNLKTFQEQVATERTNAYTHAVTLNRQIRAEIKSKLAERDHLTEQYEVSYKELRCSYLVAMENYKDARAMAGLLPELLVPDPVEPLPTSHDYEDDETASSQNGLTGHQQLPVRQPFGSSLRTGMKKVFSLNRKQEAIPSSQETDDMPAMQHSPYVTVHPSEDPTKVPLPLEEAEQRARSIHAIAIEQGLPSRGPAASYSAGSLMLSRAWHNLKLAFSTLVCGSVFGFSIGIITGMIDPEVIAIQPARYILSLLMLTFIGTLLFSIIGAAVRSLASAASEAHTNGIVAQIQDNNIAMGQRIAKTFKSLAWATIIAAIAMLVIEAVVERNGIAHYFKMRDLNQLILSGHLGNVSHNISGFTLWTIALMAGLPFIVLHASEAWSHTRQKVVDDHLLNLRSKEIHTIANELHAKRIIQSETRLENEIQDISLRREYALLKEAAKSATYASEVSVKGASPQPETDLDEEMEERISNQIITLNQDPRFMKLNAEICREIAKGRVRVTFKNREIKKLNSRYRSDLISINKEIDELKSRLLPEERELTESDFKRLDDYSCDLEQAVRSFDMYMQQNRSLIMRSLQGGLFHRIRAYFLAKPLVD